jgi:hypothetical protein
MGVSLLVGGFLQLRSGISVYHWQVVVYLVWFSSFTHLATLTILRENFAEIPPIRRWRVAIMSLIVIGNISAILSTGNLRWISTYRSLTLILAIAIVSLGIMPWFLRSGPGL